MIQKIIYLLICSITLNLFFINKTELEYNNYLLQFNKKYLTQKEYFYHYKIFEYNIKIYKKENLKNKNYKLGITKFSDIKKYNLNKKVLKSKTIDETEEIEYETKNEFKKDNYKLDSSKNLNWISLNKNIEIKDQGDCGGCYAFASSSLISHLYKILKNKDLNLSAQQIIDCSSIFGNSSCSGGNGISSLKFIQQFGLLKNKFYPFISYHNKYQRCKMIKYENITKYKISYFKRIYPKNYLINLKFSPILIRINDEILYHYKGGIIDSENCNSDDISHSILLIGYGVENGIKYWLLQNSWGKEFGLIKILRKDSGPQLCGIDKVAFMAKL